MFDSVELPSEICKHLVSITPILGISGSFDNYSLWMLPKYFPISSNQILIPFSSKEPPEELSLNILRKGEDDTMIATYKQSKLDSKVLEEGKKIEITIAKTIEVMAPTPVDTLVVEKKLK